MDTISKVLQNQTFDISTYGRKTSQDRTLFTYVQYLQRLVQSKFKIIDPTYKQKQGGTKERGEGQRRETEKEKERGRVNKRINVIKFTFGVY